MRDSHAKARLNDAPGVGKKARQGPLGVFNRRVWRGPAAVEALLAIRPEEAVIDASTPVFRLHPDTIRRRLQQAARAAGLPGWQEITGHSGRVGMAQDLSSAGFALPELMTAGRWK